MWLSFIKNVHIYYIDYIPQEVDAVPDENKNPWFKVKWKAILAVLIPVVFIVSLASSIKGKIMKGTYINGIDAGGMSEKEAVIMLDKEFNANLGDSFINLRHEDKLWKLYYKDINARFDTAKAAKQAVNITRDSGIVERILVEMGLKKKIKSMEMDLQYDTDKIVDNVTKISKEINKGPVDAKISFDGKKFKITPDVPGAEVDLIKLISMIRDYIRPSLEEGTLYVPVISIGANKTYEMLNAVKTKLSTFYTAFHTGDSNRNTNLMLSTKAVSSTLLMPGEVFSFNKTLGPRLAKYGYMEAPVIVNGELVHGIGGGICQVSSTLYNAALLANLDIVERKNHGFPSSYIGLGRDATISENYIDLRFKNNRKYPIFLYGYILENRLYFEIYGDDTTRGMKVDIETSVVEVVKPKGPKITEDPNMPIGAEIIKVKPKDGYKVKVYRKTYKDGNLVKNELLGTDYYKAVDGEIIRGTKQIS